MNSLSFISSLLGNAQQAFNIGNQISANREENERNRQYNWMMARWQHEQSLAQWHRQNEYNSPRAMMQRYKDAGLNPDLIYNMSSPSAQSPTLATPSPSSPADLSALSRMPTFNDVINQALNSSLISSETKKNIAEVNELDKQLEVMQNTIWKLQAEVGLLNEQEVSEFNKHLYQDKELKLLSEELKIKEEEAKHICETITTNILLNRATIFKFGKDSYMLEKLGDKYAVEKVGQETINELNKKYGESDILLDISLKSEAFKMNSRDFENYWFNKVFGIVSSALSGSISSGISLLKKK